MFGKLTDRIKELMAEGDGYDAMSTAPSTRGLYKRMWTIFEQWCETHDVECLPAAPEVIAVYITDLAETVEALFHRGAFGGDPLHSY